MISVLDPYTYLDQWQGVLPETHNPYIPIPPEAREVIAGERAWTTFTMDDWDSLLLDLPPTPLNGDRPTDKENLTSETLILAIADAADCDILSYPDEKNGEFIHQIIPLAGREDSKSNEGAAVFEAHIEAPHVQHPPDMVLLLALRNEERGATAIWAVDDIVSGLPTDVVRQLQLPEFEFASGESWSDAATYRYPLLSADARMIRVDLTAISALNESAQHALDALRDFCVSSDGSVRNCHRHVLEPGEVLLFDNRRVAHGRAGFSIEGVAPEHRRWYQRAYLRRKQPSSTGEQHAAPH